MALNQKWPLVAAQMVHVGDELGKRGLVELMALPVEPTDSGLRIARALLRS
jgi:hypothetical protein